MKQTNKQTGFDIGWMCEVRVKEQLKFRDQEGQRNLNRGSSHSHLLPGFLLINETQMMETDGHIKRWREKETEQMIR